MKPAAFCPHCGFDLVKDQPIILNDFSMFGPGAPLQFQGRSLTLTATEGALVWALLKAVPSPVACDVLLDRVGSDGDERTIDVFVCRIRKKLKAAGAPNVIGTARRRDKRAFVWLLKGGQNERVLLAPEASVPDDGDPL